MMARPLPQWCKNVKIELVRRDMSISITFSSLKKCAA